MHKVKITKEFFKDQISKFFFVFLAKNTSKTTLYKSCKIIAVILLSGEIFYQKVQIFVSAVNIIFVKAT